VTSNTAVGVIVPIPTSPSDCIIIAGWLPTNDTYAVVAPHTSAPGAKPLAYTRVPMYALPRIIKHQCIDIHRGRLGQKANAVINPELSAAPLILTLSPPIVSVPSGLAASSVPGTPALSL
jgi:hypothetical protein